MSPKGGLRNSCTIPMEQVMRMPEKPRTYSAPLRSKPVYRKQKEILESLGIKPEHVPTFLKS